MIRDTFGREWVGHRASGDRRLRDRARRAPPASDPPRVRCVYKADRPHMSLGGDAPPRRDVEVPSMSRVVAMPKARRPSFIIATRGSRRERVFRHHSEAIGPMSCASIVVRLLRSIRFGRLSLLGLPLDARGGQRRPTRYLIPVDLLDIVRCPPPRIARTRVRAAACSMTLGCPASRSAKLASSPDGRTE
jgi:hypothetical protein